MGIEHENTILELKEKNQKLKRKLSAAEEDAADKAEEAKNLAVRLAVRPHYFVAFLNSLVVLANYLNNSFVWAS